MHLNPSVSALHRVETEQAPSLKEPGLHTVKWLVVGNWAYTLAVHAEHGNDEKNLVHMQDLTTYAYSF
jgi:hypothetical protein